MFDEEDSCSASLWRVKTCCCSKVSVEKKTSVLNNTVALAAEHKHSVWDHLQSAALLRCQGTASKAIDMQWQAIY